MFKAARVDTIMLGGARPGNQLGGIIKDKKIKKKVKKRFKAARVNTIMLGGAKPGNQQPAWRQPLSSETPVAGFLTMSSPFQI